MKVFSVELSLGWLVVVLLCVQASRAQVVRDAAFFRPGQVWVDDRGVAINAHGGGVLFYGRQYYWFGEHKVEGEKGNKAWVGVHCYVSDDLYHWTDAGVVLPVDSSAWSLLQPGSIIERPKVLYNKKSGLFVMWFHLELKGKGYKAALCGVATSRAVTGPYVFDHAERPDKQSWPVNRDEYDGGDSLVKRDFEVGQMARDMNLFQDDDGAAYLLYTSEENRTLHISRLADDYLHTAGQYARVFPGRYMEASAMFKHRDRYYLVASGCTGWAPNAARSAVADHPLGPWKELGNPCRGSDSALTFHGQSTYVLAVAGKPGQFIFMADKWNPVNAIDGRYLWLPVRFRGEGFYVPWFEHWQLGEGVQ